jgi:hypothetical protein
METKSQRVSLFGRLADDLTRDVIPGGWFDASLVATGRRALRKDDGYFVFTDLKPAMGAYEVSVRARYYQRRTLSATIPTTTAVQLANPGEDELFVVVTGVDASARRVSFDPLPFVPTIRSGANVFGPDPFVATLDEPLEGSEVDFGILNTVAGLAIGAILRVVRSTNVILQPGPYYPFDADTTLVVIKVVEDTAGDPPIEGAAIVIDQINSGALSTTTIGGLPLHTFALAGKLMLLGPDRGRQTITNERGDAVFYLPFGTPATAMRLQISRTGYNAATETITITSWRTARTVRLNRT